MSAHSKPFRIREVRHHEDVEQIREIVENKLAPLGRKVYAIVNYDNFEIFPDVIDEYSAMTRILPYLIALKLSATTERPAIPNAIVLKMSRS